MDRDEAQARMAEIQRIMERATLYTLLPGAASVIGGILILMGCAASVLMFHSLPTVASTLPGRYVDFATMRFLPLKWQLIFCGMWFGIGVVGIAQEVLLTARAARRQGISPTARPLRFALFSLTPSVVVAMVLTLKFLAPDLCRLEMMPDAKDVQYIVPVWMMLYGTGVYTAGLFSLRPPRVLGLLFIGAGAVALLFFQRYGVVTAALSFGMFHVLFGVYVLGKQRQGVAP